MVGDGEPVGLVTDPLQQVQPLGRAGQDHGVLLAGQPHLLQAFGQPAQGDLPGQAEFLQHPRGRGHLRGATVDDDQGGRVGELAGGACGGVHQQRPGLVLVAAAFVQQPAEATAQHLVHGRDVVGSLEALDDEPPVVGFAGQAVLEDHHGADDLGALGV